MAEFFGDLERLAADLYPYRWPIAAGGILAMAAVVVFGYRQGWHVALWNHRRPAAIICIPVLTVVGFVGYDLGSPLFINKTVNSEFPFAFTAIVPPDMSREQVEEVMAGMAMVDQVVQEAMPDLMTAAKAPQTRDSSSRHRERESAKFYGLSPRSQPYPTPLSRQCGRQS